LQSIRKDGRQDEVRFLELQLMPEFIEAGPSAKSKYQDKNDRQSSRLEFLGEFGNLEGLRVDHLFLTENDLKLIGRCHSLKKLSLSGVQIMEASHGKHRLCPTELRHLNQLTNLEVLDLSQSRFSGGLQHLAGLPRLHTLILASFEHLNDASVAQLKQLPHLQTLVLAPVYANNSERTVTDAGLASLKDLPSLQTLYIGYHGKWTIPVEKLRLLLPEVNVQRGFQVRISGDPGVSPQRPVETREEQRSP